LERVRQYTAAYASEATISIVHQYPRAAAHLDDLLIRPDLRGKSSENSPQLGLGQLCYFAQLHDLMFEVKVDCPAMELLLPVL
jgi:hypothetical protein